MGMHFSPPTPERRRPDAAAGEPRPTRKTDLVYRVAGVVILGGSFGTTFLHRALQIRSQAHPSVVVAGGLVLTTMVLAAAGLLLLIHGARLFHGEARSRIVSPPVHRRSGAPATRHDPAFDPVFHGEGRIALASYLAYRARIAAERTRPARPDA